MTSLGFPVDPEYTVPKRGSSEFIEVHEYIVELTPSPLTKYGYPHYEIAYK
jgi:hypothetical protein